MAESKNKPLMRSLGEFFGHIVKAIKTDPAAKSTVVRKEVTEEKQGDLVLRRTTIEEIEVKTPPGSGTTPGSRSTPAPGSRSAEGSEEH